MSLYGIILAAGSGVRLGRQTPKAFLTIGKQKIYEYSLKTFISTKKFKKIVLVIPKYIHLKLKNVYIVVGGETRNDSFENAMHFLGKLNKNDKIFVHDAARIFVQKKDILKMINSRKKQGTLCYTNIKTQLGNGDLIYKQHHIQTPQFCTYETYINAKKNSKGKDLFTYLNLKHKKSDFFISSNKHMNFKITFPEDLIIAQLLI